MQFTSIAVRGTALAVIAGALIAAGPAAAQRGGAGNYGSMQSTAPSTSSQAMSNMSNMSSRESQPISQVRNPTATLASANVQDSSGQTIGQVRSVSTTADGKASAVNVSLTSANGTARVVSIGANNLMYDSDSKTLKSSLTQSQINSLPATQSP